MSKVTIVIPAYNAEKTLAETINSVLNQSHEDWELLVIDDGSSDKTFEIACKYQKKHPEKIFAIHQKNQGPSSARNNGLKKAKGDFIAFLDSDDIYLENRLKRVVELFQTNPNIDWITTDAFLWYPESDKKIRYYKKYHLPKKPTLDENLKRNFVFGLPIIKKEIVSKVGFQDPELTGVEDYDYWNRIFYNGFKLKIIKTPLCLYRQTTNSLSKQNKKLELATLKMFDKYKKEFKLTKEQKEIISFREKKIYLSLADNSAISDTNLAINYYKNVGNTWSKISIWMLGHKMKVLWMIMFRIKKILGNIIRISH